VRERVGVAGASESGAGQPAPSSPASAGVGISCTSAICILASATCSHTWCRQMRPIRRVREARRRIRPSLRRSSLRCSSLRRRRSRLAKLRRTRCIAEHRGGAVPAMTLLLAAFICRGAGASGRLCAETSRARTSPPCCCREAGAAGRRCDAPFARALLASPGCARAPAGPC